MKPVLVLYATRESQSAHIAAHIARLLRETGQPTEALDVAGFETFDLTSHSKVILIAAMHRGKHEPEMVKLATKYRRELDQLPTALLSVSLTGATAVSASASPEERADASRSVSATMDGFFAETGWHPSDVTTVAGALPYSKVNFVVRFVVKQLAKQGAGNTGMSPGHGDTSWPELNRFIEEIRLPRAS